MKIIASFDSFKGGMSAKAACAVAQRAILEVAPLGHIESIPLADGGEGTAEILREALGGEWISVTTVGPLPKSRVNSGFVWVADRKLAIVEMSRSSGLTLVPPSNRNPLLTTTYGTGELLKAARALDPREIWLTVGGSATVDGGVGAAIALGWRFLDAQGRPLSLGGGALAHLVTIQQPNNWTFPPCTVLCDVTNPLLGSQGAARVFGPQKGATTEMIERLDHGLRNLATLAKRHFGVDLSDLRGGGAAGGLAAGAVLFFDAKLASGIETVLTALRYLDRVRGADWIITGEGRFDEQSLSGKVISGVLQAARRVGAHVAVLAGSVKLSEVTWRAAGIEYAASLAPPDTPLEQAILHERENLARQIKDFCARCLLNK